MYETHEQSAQLLAVECVLLLCYVHFNLSGGNVIEQDSDQLEQEPGTREHSSSEGEKENCGSKKERIEPKHPILLKSNASLNYRQWTHVPSKGFFRQGFLCITIRFWDTNCVSTGWVIWRGALLMEATDCVAREEMRGERQFMHPGQDDVLSGLGHEDPENRQDTGHPQLDCSY